MHTTQQVIAFVVVGLALVAFVVAGQVLPLALQLHLSGTHIPMGTLLRWKWKRVDATTLAINAIRAHKHNLMIPVDQLEAHVLAGGNVTSCISALIAARNHQIDTHWGEVTRWDLDGLDPLHLINDAVEPAALPPETPPDPNAPA